MERNYLDEQAYNNDSTTINVSGVYVCCQCEHNFRTSYVQLSSATTCFGRFGHCQVDFTIICVEKNTELHLSTLFHTLL